MKKPAIALLLGLLANAIALTPASANPSFTFEGTWHIDTAPAPPSPTHSPPAFPLRLFVR